MTAHGKWYDFGQDDVVDVIVSSSTSGDEVEAGVDEAWQLREASELTASTIQPTTSEATITANAVEGNASRAVL